MQSIAGSKLAAPMKLHEKQLLEQEYLLHAHNEQARRG